MDGKFFKDKTVLVTGGAGFIGSHLVDRLMELGANVKVIDNLSMGSINNLSNCIGRQKFKFLKKDVTKMDDVSLAVKDCEIVFHLAANPEVREQDPLIHFEQNVVGTFNVLEAARLGNVKNFVFTSSSVVYGEAKKIPTPESYSPLDPISFYGTAKLVAENLIRSYANMYGIMGSIFRLANVVGPRSHRGVVYDFVKKLRNNPKRLEVLGDGTQVKSYIWIDDCIDGILEGMKSTDMVSVYNIGSVDTVRVTKIADIVTKEMKLHNVKIEFTGGADGGRGWAGDVKHFHLDVSKLMSTGWKIKYGSEEAIRLAARSFLKI